MAFQSRRIFVAAAAIAVGIFVVVADDLNGLLHRSGPIDQSQTNTTAKDFGQASERKTADDSAGLAPPLSAEDQRAAGAEVDADALSKVEMPADGGAADAAARSIDGALEERTATVTHLRDDGRSADSPQGETVADVQARPHDEPLAEVSGHVAVANAGSEVDGGAPDTAGRSAEIVVQDRSQTVAQHLDGQHVSGDDRETPARTVDDAQPENRAPNAPTNVESPVDESAAAAARASDITAAEEASKRSSQHAHAESQPKSEGLDREPSEASGGSAFARVDAQADGGAADTAARSDEGGARQASGTDYVRQPIDGAANVEEGASAPVDSRKHSTVELLSHGSTSDLGPAADANHGANVNGGAADAVASSTESKAQEQLAQSANRDSNAGVGELFARAAERTPRWTNPATGLFQSEHPAVDAGDGKAAAASNSNRTQEQVAQSDNRGSTVEVDELFARAAERTPGWTNPVIGLLQSDHSTVDGPAANAVAARPPAEAPAGTVARRPADLSDRKRTLLTAGGKSGSRGVGTDSDKAFGKPALPSTGRLVLASRVPEKALGRDEVTGQMQTTTARFEEGSAIQALIQKQLRAFANDDSVTAYRFAAPGIRKRFPDEATFMRMVKQGYAPVYRHKHAVFGKLSEHGEGRIQAVKFTDQSGHSWLALYTLEKQPDGSWRISGCTLMKHNGV